jgi:hypothetical protein
VGNFSEQNWGSSDERRHNYIKIGSRIAYRSTDVLAYENQHYVKLG